jgi:hypothetical protein
MTSRCPSSDECSPRRGCLAPGARPAVVQWRRMWRHAPGADGVSPDAVLDPSQIMQVGAGF